MFRTTNVMQAMPIEEIRRCIYTPR